MVTPVELEQRRLLLLLDKGLESLCEDIFNHYGSCNDCLHPICCTAASPSLFSSEVIKISQYLGISEKRFKKEYVIKLNLPKIRRRLIEPCPFLKNNRCSIYEKRPKACRTFPLESSILTGAVRLESITMCPVATLISEEFNEFYDEYKHLIPETSESKALTQVFKNLNEELQDKLAESIGMDESHENWFMMTNLLFFICFYHYKIEGMKDITKKFESYQKNAEELLDFLVRNVDDRKMRKMST